MMPASASATPSPAMSAASRRGPVADTVRATPSMSVTNDAYSSSAVIVARGAIDSAWRSTAPRRERDVEIGQHVRRLRRQRGEQVPRKRHDLHERCHGDGREADGREHAWQARHMTALYQGVRSTRRRRRPPTARRPSRRPRRTRARPMPGRASSPYDSHSRRPPSPADRLEAYWPLTVRRSRDRCRRAGKAMRTPRRAAAGRPRRSRRSPWSVRAAAASRASRSRRTGTGGPVYAASGSARRRPWPWSDGRCAHRIRRTARIRGRRRRSGPMQPERRRAAVAAAADAGSRAATSTVSSRSSSSCTCMRNSLIPSLSLACAILMWQSAGTTGEAMITALTPWAAISASSSYERPSTGKPLTSLPVLAGSSSTKPIGFSPVAGFSNSSWMAAMPCLPAPYTRTGLP